MRNLVFVHLESLNYVNYRVNQNMFSNLSAWKKRSLSFSRYFSTATSTLMVVADLVYGGLFQYEMCNSLDYIPDKYYYKDSLLDVLRKQGYVTKALYFPDTGDVISAQQRHIVGFRNELEMVSKYEEFIMEIERSINGRQPFVLLLCNTVSNVSLNLQIPGGELESGLDRWKGGYEFIDACVGKLMDSLASRGLLNHTTIIFYGDHGDDYFAHGNHTGLTHAIEPYGNLIHAPFWIYDSRLISGGRCDDLISTVDIRKIVEKVLSMPEKKFCWKELGIQKNPYVLARNAYAAQPVRAGSFNKGYSLTDGRFLILVSNNGMEMYDIEMDVQCQNNLLKFFTYEEDILYLNEELNSSLDYHYKRIINLSAIRQIRQKFYFYRKRLIESVEKLFRCAECEEKMKELDFNNIHYI